MTWQELAFFISHSLSPLCPVWNGDHFLRSHAYGTWRGLAVPLLRLTKIWHATSFPHCIHYVTVREARERVEWRDEISSGETARASQVRGCAHDFWSQFPAYLDLMYFSSDQMLFCRWSSADRVLPPFFPTWSKFKFITAFAAKLLPVHAYFLCKDL